MGKFLGTLRVRRNYAHSFYIHDRSHYEFNMWISLWMWDEWVSFFVFRGYLRITHFSEYDDFNWNVTKSLFWFFFLYIYFKKLISFHFCGGSFWDCGLGCLLSHYGPKVFGRRVKTGPIVHKPIQGEWSHAYDRWNYYKRVTTDKYITTIKDKRSLLVKKSKEFPIREKSSTIIESALQKRNNNKNKRKGNTDNQSIKFKEKRLVYRA